MKNNPSANECVELVSENLVNLPEVFGTDLKVLVDMILANCVRFEKKNCVTSRKNKKESCLTKVTHAPNSLTYMQGKGTVGLVLAVLYYERK